MTHVFIHRTTNCLQFHCGHDLAECTVMYYPAGRNISFLKYLLRCNVDFSELSLHLNSTDVKRVLFYTTQKICNLSLFFELGSYLICLYTIGPKNACSRKAGSLHDLSLNQYEKDNQRLSAPHSPSSP